jgi:hypothetical protein
MRRASAQDTSSWPDMHAVAIELHREVGPIVHDEGDARAVGRSGAVYRRRARWRRRRHFFRRSWKAATIAAVERGAQLGAKIDGWSRRSGEIQVKATGHESADTGLGQAIITRWTPS